MKIVENVLVVGDSWHSLLVCCALRKRIANLKITLVLNSKPVQGAISVRRETLSLLSTLGLSHESLLRLCDGTYCMAHHIFGAAPEHDFFWATDDYGVSDEAVDFNYLFERYSPSCARYDDFSVMAQMAKHRKVAATTAAKFDSAEITDRQTSIGMHLNAVAFHQLLLRYAVHLKVTVLSGVTVSIDNAEEYTGTAILDSSGSAHTPDLLIDACGANSDFSSDNLDSVDDWTDYFDCQSSLSLFVADQFNPEPVSKLKIESNLLLNMLPLRSGVMYEYLGAKAEINKFLSDLLPLDEKNNVKSEYYGCLVNPWCGRKVNIGPKASRPGQLLVSQLDLLLREIDLLIDFWPAIPFQKNLMREYNRLAVDLYCSVRDIHLTLYWLIKAGTNIELRRLPPVLRMELETFFASSRLPHRDYRYPVETEWLSVLMGLKNRPTHFPMLQLERSDELYPDFFRQISQKIRTVVAQSPDHVTHINTLLRQ